MSESNEDRVRRHRAEERQVRRQGGETGNRVESDDAPDSYVIEAPSRRNPVRAVSDFRSGANVNTGLGDPRLATWLYTAVVVTAVMFSKKWKEVSSAVVAGAKK